MDRNSSPGYSGDVSISGDRNESKSRPSRAGSTSSNIVAADDGESSLAASSSTIPSRSTAKRQTRAAKVDMESGEGVSSSKGTPGATKGTLAKSGSTVQGKTRASKR